MLNMTDIITSVFEQGCLQRLTTQEVARDLGITLIRHRLRAGPGASSRPGLSKLRLRPSSAIFHSSAEILPVLGLASERTFIQQSEPRYLASLTLHALPRAHPKQSR